MGVDTLNMLSKDTIKKISISGTKSKEEVDTDTYLLTDGTIITIDKVRGGLKIPENYLSNPNGVNITCECMALIKFKENPDDEKYKIVRFYVSSITDLEIQWKKYKSVKKYPDNLIGIIDTLEFTKEQMDAINKIGECLEKISTVLLSKKKYVNDDLKVKIATNIITAGIDHCILAGDIDKVFYPIKVIDGNGRTIGINNFITKDLVMTHIKRIEPEDFYFNEEDYDDEEENKE